MISYDMIHEFWLNKFVHICFLMLQKISSRNKSNRSLQTNIPRVGRKGFVGLKAVLVCGISFYFNYFKCMNVMIVHFLFGIKQAFYIFNFVLLFDYYYVVEIFSVMNYFVILIVTKFFELLTPLQRENWTRITLPKNKR